MDFDEKYYQVNFSAALNEQNETVYSIGRINERRFPTRSGSSSKNEARNYGRKSSNPIIYTTEDKSQEVKTAIQLAFVIRNDENGKKFLYDLINIKQDKSNKLSDSWRTKIDNTRSTYPAVDKRTTAIRGSTFRG